VEKLWVASSRLTCISGKQAGKTTREVLAPHLASFALCVYPFLNVGFRLRGFT